MYTTNSFLILVQVLGLLFIFCGETSASCQTPKGENGECKSISDCQPLLLLLQKQPRKPEDVDHLRRSQCGIDGSYPKVCCPVEDTSSRSANPVEETKPIDFCVTSRREQGECISVSNCQAFLSILRNKPVKPDDQEYLRKSQCGSDAYLPKVCCPFEVKPITSNLLPSVAVCGDSKEERIYGGTKAELNEHPWMALLEYKNGNERGFYCGGTLINKRYILTAAHCMKGGFLASWKLVSVRLGEHNTNTNPDCTGSGDSKFCTPSHIDIPVEEGIIHEGYDPDNSNQYHDIGLLRLSKDVQFTDSVKPICLPTTSFIQNINLAGRKLVVAGWGKTENRSESNIKLKLEVPFKPSINCVRSYASANVQLSNTQLCAGGEKGKDSCSGDSGGPLMQQLMDENGDFRWYSLGIVSFGPSRCGMDKWPGVYTKVDSYIKWIDSKLKP